jgi:hypothetical protein
MTIFRWLIAAILIVTTGIGCSGERRPDTDPSDQELNVPEVSDK